MSELTKLFEDEIADWKRELSEATGNGVNYISSLRMLPVFGKQIPGNEINFKFPSDDLFEHINGMEMDLMEVRLSSIFIRSSFP